MFGWFGKKEERVPEAKVMSHIAASRAEALNALALKLKASPAAQVFYYFEESKQQFIGYLQQYGIPFKEESNSLLHTDAVYFHDAGKFSASASVEERNFYCIDYFPAYFEFNKLQRHLAVANPKAELHVYAGLDEPLFKLFGSDRILTLMKRMGMKEGELVEHRMITDSIENAQKKVQERALSNLPAYSAREWFDKNFRDEKL